MGLALESSGTWSNAEEMGRRQSHRAVGHDGGLNFTQKRKTLESFNPQNKL